MHPYLPKLCTLIYRNCAVLFTKYCAFLITDFCALLFTDHTDRCKAHIARELVSVGSMEGLKYLSNYLKINSEVVAMMQLDPQVACLNTAAALEILFDIAEILVDPSHEVTRPPSARHVLRGWLNALSAKSEADLLLVKEFIEKADNELKIRFPGPSELKWYAEQILENSRTKSEQGLDISQVKRLLHKLEIMD